MCGLDQAVACAVDGGEDDFVLRGRLEEDWEVSGVAWGVVGE